MICLDSMCLPHIFTFPFATAWRDQKSGNSRVEKAENRISSVFSHLDHLLSTYWHKVFTGLQKMGVWLYPQKGSTASVPTAFRSLLIRKGFFFFYRTSTSLLLHKIFLQSTTHRFQANTSKLLVICNPHRKHFERLIQIQNNIFEVEEVICLPRPLSIFLL